MPDTSGALSRTTCFWLERRLPDAYAALLNDVTVYSATDDPTNPLADLPRAEAIIAGSRQRYDDDFLDRAPRLRVISRTGVGYDNVDVTAATARGICVCHTPDAPTISTAELALTLIMTVARDVKRVVAELERGARSEYFTTYQGLELNERSLGVVGLGRIGSRVATMARGVGLRVLAYDPYVDAARAAARDVTLAPTLAALLGAVDIVTLHVPASADTRHLIDATRLAQMRPGAILINTARGALVDEEALVAALDSGHLAGAGLDVLQHEPPPPEHPLLGRPNVVVTPHIGSATPAGRDRLWTTAVAQARQVLRGDMPPGLLNPDVWLARRGAPEVGDDV